MSGETCRCGEPLAVPTTGRPPRYCSATCRRSAEYEIRRWQQLLLRAQKAEQDARLVLAVRPHQQAHSAQAYWATEVNRLLDILDDVLAESEAS